MRKMKCQMVQQWGDIRQNHGKINQQLLKLFLRAVLSESFRKSRIKNERPSGGQVQRNRTAKQTFEYATKYQPRRHLFE